MDTTKIIEGITERGYHVVPEVLTGARCDELIDACRAVHDRFATSYATAPSTVAVHGRGDIALVHNLHNKGSIFRELIFHPLVDAVASQLLSAGSYLDSEPYQLALSQARGLRGRHEAQQLHIDSYLPGLPYVLVLQAGWILSEFSEEAGATQIVPGSRERREFAPDGVPQDATIVEAPRGSLLFFDGGLWHGSSVKSTDDERWAIFNRYSRWFMRQSFDLTRNTPRDVYDQLDDRQRAILGFRFEPPVDEFTRVTRIASEPEFRTSYHLPE